MAQQDWCDDRRGIFYFVERPGPVSFTGRAGQLFAVHTAAGYCGIVSVSVSRGFEVRFDVTYEPIDLRLVLEPGHGATQLIFEGVNALSATRHIAKERRSISSSLFSDSTSSRYDAPHRGLAEGVTSALDNL